MPISKQQSQQDQKSIESFDFAFRILILGDCGVGKSALITGEINEDQSLTSATSNNSESEKHSANPSMLSIHNKSYLIDGQYCRVQFWDQTGSPTYHRFTNRFIAGAAGAICLFDINRPESFQGIEQWIERLRTHGGHKIPFVLAGRLNRAQQQHNNMSSKQQAQQQQQTITRLVSIEQAKRLVEKYETEYFEVFDAASRRQLFLELVRRVIKLAVPKPMIPMSNWMLNHSIMLGDRYTDPQHDPDLCYRQSIFASTALSLLPVATTTTDTVTSPSLGTAAMAVINPANASK